MVNFEAFQEFRLGLVVLRGGKAEEALAHLRLALNHEPDNPFYLSYVGVATAAADQEWEEAEQMCRTALRLNRRQVQLYLNLAEVYVAADRKLDAADVLAKGLHIVPHDQRLQMAMDRLSIRRAAVLSFLPRGHVVNRNLGKLRHRACQVLASF